MCRTLGVSTSGYYAWLLRAPCARNHDNTVHQCSNFEGFGKAEQRGRINDHQVVLAFRLIEDRPQHNPNPVRYPA